MKAMIFCAGLGTRFKPWTDHHPKALALVNGKSLLQRNVEFLQSHGIYDVIVNVHHFPDQIEDAVYSNNGWGSNIIISDERNEVLETGGGLLQARAHFANGENFLTLNADILTDLNIPQFLRFHEEENALISLAVSTRKSSRCFLFNEKKQLTGWRNLQTGHERISIEDPTATPLAFSGMSILNERFFDVLELTGKFSLVDAYLSLAATQPIRGFEHSHERWVDVGRPESVAVAEALFA